MISKTEKSILGNIKMAFPLPLLLALLFTFSFSVENFAQSKKPTKTEKTSVSDTKDTGKMTKKQKERIKILTKPNGDDEKLEVYVNNTKIIPSEKSGTVNLSIHKSSDDEKGKVVIMKDGEITDEFDIDEDFELKLDLDYDDEDKKKGSDNE